MIEEIGAVMGGEHYLAVMLILIFSCILINRGILSERVHQGNFWITIVVCAFLIAQDVFENIAQQDPARRDLRMLTSIAGYSLRPAAVLGFLLVIWPAEKQSWFLWVPVVVNGMLYCSALYLPLTFYFDENYAFQRGPLGGVMFYVCIGYLILVLFMISRRFRDRRAGDIVVIYLCAFGCLGAMAVDVLIGGVAIISAILISSMVFYLFLRNQDLDHDPLTRLWNRRVFYEDCRKSGNAVTAVASIDMNGLKKTNDELGHDAGDRALKMIGRGLREIMNKKIFAYRVGGDEFMILFVHCEAEEIKQAVMAFLDDMWRAGRSVAIGLATKMECNVPLEELIRISDQRMYEDKSEYYRRHDRRRAKR